VNYPVVLGHVFGGRIVELGAEVTGWQEGQRVVAETAAIISPENPMTRRELDNLDSTRKGFGYGVDGAMTRFVRVPSRILHEVPDHLKLEEACLAEPCCVAYNAGVKNARIEPGDRVLVLGPGTIGILCAAMARLCGAEVAISSIRQGVGFDDWISIEDGGGRHGPTEAQRGFPARQAGGAFLAIRAWNRLTAKLREGRSREPRQREGRGRPSAEHPTLKPET